MLLFSLSFSNTNNQGSTIGICETCYLLCQRILTVFFQEAPVFVIEPLTFLDFQKQCFDPFLSPLSR